MKRRFIVFVCVVILGIVALFVMRLLFYEGIVRMNYVSEQRYPVQGIDVSHHQGEIDWHVVLQGEIDFVFVKATEADVLRDRQFVNNWQALETFNIPRSAYHFFHFCTDGISQAENFIATVPNDEFMLAPIVDIEFGGNCVSYDTHEAIAVEIALYIDTIELRYGKAPILYLTEDAYEVFAPLLSEDFTRLPLWIRNVYGKPRLPESISWTFWQYANRGHIDGIEGFVDLNVFMGSEADFVQFMNDYDMLVSP